MKIYVFFILVIILGVSIQETFAEESEMIQSSYMHFPVGEKFFQYKTNPPLVLAEEVQNRCWFTSTFVNQEESGEVVYQFPKDMIWPGAYDNSTFFLISYETADMRDGKSFQKITPQYLNEKIILKFEIQKGISQLLVNSTNYFESDSTTLKTCKPLFDLPPKSSDYYDHIFPPRIQKNYAAALGFSDNIVMCKSGHEIVTKKDGKLACVTLETKNKLIQRGWTKSNLDNV